MSFSSGDQVAAIAEASGGSVRRLVRGDTVITVPRIQTVRGDARAYGADWIGISPTGSVIIRGVSVTPLALGLLGLLLLLGAVLAAWLGESRRPTPRA